MEVSVTPVRLVESEKLALDLDGTLTDPRLGFVRCLRYALGFTGESLPSDDVLATFIGPPLEQTMRQLLGALYENELTQAIARYGRTLWLAGRVREQPLSGSGAALGALVAKG